MRYVNLLAAAKKLLSRRYSDGECDGYTLSEFADAVEAAEKNEEEGKEDGADILLTQMGHELGFHDSEEYLDGTDRVVKELEELRKLPALLDEWLNTPFFEDKDAWQKWVEDFRPRVQDAIIRARNARG